VQALAEAAERMTRSDDAEAIEAATKALTQGTEAFAAARMNHGIRQALAGRKVEEI
jgi:molecular chaperone HscA